MNDTRRQIRVGFDWSAQPSGYSAADVRPAAVQRARDYLRDSGEDHSLELAESTDQDLLHRLNVITAAGQLTHAGAIAFVGRSSPALDYVLREVPGGDSLIRIRKGRRGLIEELFDVEQAINSANRIRHVPNGLVSGQIRQLPPRAVREAVVNGCVHRDWSSVDPTLVEHLGSTLVVTSWFASATPLRVSRRCRAPTSALPWSPANSMKVGYVPCQRSGRQASGEI